MQQTGLQTSTITGSAESSEYALTVDDYRFIGHHEPGRFFDRTQRPLRLIRTLPPLSKLSNVIYTPATRRSKPFDGALYDEDLARVSASCVVRGRNDELLATDAPRFPGNPNELSMHECPVLYLGHINSHYGHFLLESFSQWWAMSQGYDIFEHYLVHVHDPSVLNLPHVQACLKSMHITPEKLLYFDQPVKLREVIVPAAALQIQSHIYSTYKELCNRISSESFDLGTPETEQPLYVSRRLLTSGVTGYRGESQIEEFVASRGAKVIHPQYLSFEEQVRLFCRHKRIIGIMGSGMHNLALSMTPKEVIYLTPHFVHSNYLLLDRCFCASSTYVQSCKRNHQFRILASKMRKSLVNLYSRKAEMRREPFPFQHDLDHKRIINWFLESRYVW